ncbi:MAG: NAD(P)-dependent oxidoreductase [Kofleriaceae bacterium]
MIAILGTGLLGSGFARALRRRGETVHVWNRTPTKARALERDGAVAYDDPAAAVRGATRVHIVVSDDAAVDAVLAASAAGLAPGSLVLDHTTTSTAGAIERTARWRASGITYLHVPVFMGPQNALDATGLMLLSGDRDAISRARPFLAPMTGKLVELGPRIDAAAAFKLLGNLLLMAITTGFADLLGLAQAMGVSPADATTLLDHFNPGTTLPSRFRRMVDAPYDQPSWELAMARKDARLMQAEAERGGVALAMLPAIAARMDAVLAEGHAHADWTVIAKDFLGK